MLLHHYCANLYLLRYFLLQTLWWINRTCRDAVDQPGKGVIIEQCLSLFLLL